MSAPPSGRHGPIPNLRCVSTENISTFADWFGVASADNSARKMKSGMKDRRFANRRCCLRISLEVSLENQMVLAVGIN